MNREPTYHATGTGNEQVAKSYRQVCLSQVRGGDGGCEGGVLCSVWKECDEGLGRSGVGGKGSSSSSSSSSSHDATTTTTTTANNNNNNNNDNNDNNDDILHFIGWS